MFQDRIYVRCDAELIAAVRASTLFVQVPGNLHPGFDEDSFKTRDAQAGLQLSFATGGQRVDADIDLYGNLLLHGLGEVLPNHLSGMTTDPMQVYKKLVKAGIQPEYTLRRQGRRT